jgi:hypothetical protein
MLNKDTSYVVNTLEATDWFRNAPIEAQQRFRADPFMVPLRLCKEESTVRLVGVYDETVARGIEVSVVVVKDWNKLDDAAQFLDGYSDRVLLDELELI